MSTRLEILGVFKLEVTPELFAEQLQIIGDETQCRNHLSSIVLVEALVEGARGEDVLSDVTQRHPSGLKDAAQAPWDEGLLSDDGESLLARDLGCVMGEGQLRCAFFIHFWNPGEPLVWTHGEIGCPVPQPMPERLAKLMPYRPCD